MSYQSENQIKSGLGVKLRLLDSKLSPNRNNDITNHTYTLPADLKSTSVVIYFQAAGYCNTVTLDLDTFLSGNVFPVIPWAGSKLCALISYNSTTRTLTISRFAGYSDIGGFYYISIYTFETV